MDTPSQKVEQSEAGLVAALVILLVAFGSVLAAGLPLVVAGFGLGMGLGGGWLLATVVDVPNFGVMLAMMIGVGIDYALFIVTRYRSALAEGRRPETPSSGHDRRPRGRVRRVHDGDALTLGLGLHLETGDQVDPDAAAAHTVSPAGVAFVRAAAAGWADAAAADGGDPDTAHAAAEATVSFYTTTIPEDAAES